MKAHLDITRSADETPKIPPTRTLAPVEKPAHAQSWGAFFGVEPVLVGWPAKFPRCGRFLQVVAGSDRCPGNCTTSSALPESLHRSGKTVLDLR